MFRVAAAICLLSTALLVGGCSASDKLFEAVQAPTQAIIYKLPEWAGGPPKNLPPRPGEPGYAAYELQVEGKTAQAPATQGSSAPSGQAASAASTQKAALGPLH